MRPPARPSRPRRLLSVKVDAPELPVAAAVEFAPRVHHQHVVADDEVALFPSVVVRYASVVQRSVDGLAYRLALGLVAAVNGNVGGFKLRLALRPRLVVAQAGRARRWVRLDEGDAPEGRVAKRRRRNRPGLADQAIERVSRRQAPKDLPRRGKDGEAGGAGRRRGGGEELESYWFDDFVSRPLVMGRVGGGGGTHRGGMEMIVSLPSLPVMLAVLNKPS